MPNIPRLGGAGYCQQIQPLVVAGTGWLDNTELGFSLAANAITLAASVFSNPILVVGLNSFMVIANLSGNYNISVQHCDPTTSVALVTLALRNAVPGPAATPTTFGAFSTGNLTNTVGHVWMVWRIGLQGNAADRTLTDIRVWCGTR